MSCSRGSPLATATATILEHLARVFQNMCFTEDLPPVQWSALRFLARAESAARSVSGISAYSGVSHSSASRTVSALHGKGLIEVHVCDEDGRRKRIDLTPKGWGLLGSDPLNHLIDSVGDLAPADLITLRRVAEELVSRLSAVPQPALSPVLPGGGGGDWGPDGLAGCGKPHP